MGNDALAVARGLKQPDVPPAVATLDIVHKRLGLTLKTLSATKAGEMGLEANGGLIITDVEDQSPAQAVGLRKNMIIVAIGNRQVIDEKSVPRELQKLQTGQNVRLHIIYVQQLGPFSHNAAARWC